MRCDDLEERDGWRGGRCKRERRSIYLSIYIYIYIYIFIIDSPCCMTETNTTL